MRELVRRLGVSMIIVQKDTAWRCLLSCDGRTMQASFTGEPPTIAAVLQRVADNAAAVDHSSFEDWCADFALVPNACARRVFDLCADQARQLRSLLGGNGYVTALLLAGHA